MNACRLVGMSSRCLPQITCARCIVNFREHEIPNVFCFVSLPFHSKANVIFISNTHTPSTIVGHSGKKYSGRNTVQTVNSPIDSSNGTAGMLFQLSLPYVGTYLNYLCKTAGAHSFIVRFTAAHQAPLS